MRRVVVGGGSGAGKTTFSRALAQRMGVPFIELDALFHGPNWTPTPTDVFQRTNRRIRSGEELWNGNRETFRGAYLSFDSLYVWMLRSHWRRRRTWPRILRQPEYRHLEVHRLRTAGEAARWLETVTPVSDARI